MYAHEAFGDELAAVGGDGVGKRRGVDINAHTWGKIDTVGVDNTLNSYSKNGHNKLLSAAKSTKRLYD